MTRILVVRMSALGDIVHALPVLAAIRDARPHVEVDWLVDRKYAGILQFVEGIAERVIGRPGLSRAVGRMRQRHYDVAIDLQGLLKSSAMARLSGATRVIGFDRAGLREAAAAWFYSETATTPSGGHVIQKNLAVLPVLDITPPSAPRFPLAVPPSEVSDRVMRDAATRQCDGVALINPGAAWPNKRWPAERFGQVAHHVYSRHHLVPVVLWGPQENELAESVVASSSGTAVRAPQTTIADLIALASRARLIVSGDTGPLHIAAAVGTPIVGVFGPTWPERNGPFDPRDVVVSRAAVCGCHHKRRCRRDVEVQGGESAMCLNDITVDEVKDAVDRRLSSLDGV